MAFSSMVKDINRKIILESFWDFSRNTKQDITKKPANKSQVLLSRFL